MNAAAHFPASYARGRDQFRGLARAAGARLVALPHPGKGPDGGDLSIDAAWFGPADAARALLLISATHGVEGHCGSGCQAGWLTAAGPRRLPDGMGALVIHAINPHGFAWTRRVTEDNVDLNRNFVDFDKPLPQNPAYDAIADAVAPPEWTAESRAATEKVLLDFAREHGQFALQGALQGGQYRHPGGVFFGGAAPTWSRRHFLELAERFIGRSRAVGVVDLHTGLGPYGYGEPICMHRPGTPAHARAREWYGKELTAPESGDSKSAVIVGTLGQGLERTLKDTAVTGMALEYGTQPVPDVMLALRADNWLHHHGDVGSAEGRAIKRQIRDAFYQDKDDWKEKVLARALDMIDRAVAGLARA
ncbi:MAG: M14 family metallopeptidase [Alphaproteobacteria bacterium]|nr:M14 family metallopeptidase [Alphaproteobacteria bacterium]